MNIWLRAIQGAALGCALLTCGCQKDGPGHTVRDLPDQGSKRAEVPDVEWALELTGSGLGKPALFTYEQLARMEMVRLDNVLMQKSHEADETSSWQGPSLDTLLEAAEVKPGPKKLTLKAADGYEMDCTLKEMKSAIVALRDGQGRWLAELDATRPLRLVPPHKPGDYWVANLRRITVEPVDGS